VTERVYLHVGAPKSGTTYLQAVLEQNRERLAAAGVLVVGEEHLDRVHAAMVVREDRRLEELPERASTAWTRLVQQVRDWDGPTAILSYELFAGASAEQAARALRDLDGIETHVVITARDLGTAVPSAWQERLKFALTTPLETWRPTGPRAEWGWRTMDPAGVAKRWGATLPPERVHVVTVPRDRSGDDVLWQRFASACEVAVPDLELGTTRANESLGLVAAELLRRVNEVVRAPITGNREQALWLRDTLAHDVLVHLDREPIGVTQEQHVEAQQRAASAVVALEGAGYAVHGDLADLGIPGAARREARTPSEATAPELLDAAVETIVRLLLLVRERTHERDEARRSPFGTGTSRLGALGRGAVRRVAAPVTDRRVARLQERVAELEGQVAEGRALHLRVAELTDVVTELLVPEQHSQKRITAAALRRYRGESL
jgi:hypothetical protein